MSSRRIALTLTCCWFVCVMAGCGGKTENPAVNSVPAANSTPSAVSNEPDVKPVAKQDEAKPTRVEFPKDSAAATVRKFYHDLEQGKLVDAYDFLPPSYQTDIDGLLRDFTDQMDAEIWSRLGTTARKLIRIMKSKKEFIFKLDFVQDHPHADTLRKSWDPTVDLLESLVESDLGNLSKLKASTARSLLSGSALPSTKLIESFGKAISSDLTARFSGVTIVAVSTTEPEQVVGFRSNPGEKPVEYSYVKLENHWIPKTVIENWQSGIAERRAWIKKVGERIQPTKSQILDAANRFDEMLDLLLAAENLEQFQRASGATILTLSNEWPRIMRVAMQATGASGNPSVTVEINRELTEKEQNGLIKGVIQTLDGSGSDYTLLSNGGKTICRVRNVAEVAALQTKLATHFNLAPTDVTYDADRSRIFVNLAN